MKDLNDIATAFTCINLMFLSHTTSFWLVCLNVRTWNILVFSFLFAHNFLSLSEFFLDFPV